MSEHITAAEVPAEQWPTNKNDSEAIRSLVTEGLGVLMQETDGTVLVYDDELFCTPKQAVPLLYARSTNGHLVDVRFVPTDDEKKKYPAMLCETARRTGGKLALAPVLQGLVVVLTEERDGPLPAYSPALSTSIEATQDILARIRNVGDLRMKPVLETLVAHIEAELPTAFEAIEATLPEGKGRRLYYALHHSVYAARILLHWYTVDTLYIVKKVSLNSSVGTRYDILGSDRHRAEVEFAAMYAWDRPHAADIERWVLLANDSILRVAKRLQNYPDLYDLSGEWDDRTDEEIAYWRK